MTRVVVPKTTQKTNLKIIEVFHPRAIYVTRSGQLNYERQMRGQTRFVCVVKILEKLIRNWNNS